MPEAVDDRLGEIEAALDELADRPTRPSRTGRERFLLVGTWFTETIVAVVISPLGTEACDVVSVRPASAKERAAYAEA